MKEDYHNLIGQIKKANRITMILLFLLGLSLFASLQALAGQATDLNSSSTDLSPLTNIPIDSWIYPELTKLESLNLFRGEDTVALYSRPLSRLAASRFIYRSLINLERGRTVLSKNQLQRLEKLVLEFENELTSLGIRIISRETTNQEILKDYQEDKLTETLNLFIQKGYLDPIHSGELTFPVPLNRRLLAEKISQMIFSLQDGHLRNVELTDQEIESLDYLVTELKNELSSYGIKVVYLNKRKALVNRFRDTLSLTGYLNQKIQLLGEEGIPDQGLYDLKFGTIISGEIWENTAFLADFSIDTRVFDLTNIQFSPVEFNLNRAYIQWTTRAVQIPVSDRIPVLASFDGLEVPEITWQIGRDEVRWGPGYISSLILSTKTKPLNMFTYSGYFDLDQAVGNWGNLHFTKLFSLLDDNRLLLGQRFEYSPDTPWRIGLSETAIASNNAGWLYYNPIPIPGYFYLAQQLYSNIPQLSSSENNINYNIGLDLQVQLDHGVRIYGEVMFDDFIFYQKANPAPSRYGFTIGSQFSDILENDQTDLIMEYTRIHNYVYHPREEWQNYLYQGEYLGHSLGPDADQVLVGIHHQINQETLLKLSYINERHGEGQQGISLPTNPDLAHENIFLSGTVEKSNEFLADLEYSISDQWKLSLSGSYKMISNQDNQLNENSKKLSLTAEIQFEF